MTQNKLVLQVSRHLLALPFHPISSCQSQPCNNLTVNNMCVPFLLGLQYTQTWLLNLSASWHSICCQVCCQFYSWRYCSGSSCQKALLQKPSHFWENDFLILRNTSSDNYKIINAILSTSLLTLSCSISWIGSLSDPGNSSNNLRILTTGQSKDSLYTAVQKRNMLSLICMFWQNRHFKDSRRRKHTHTKK